MMLAGGLLFKELETASITGRAMGDDRKSTHHSAEEIIAAFDRERAEANEFYRRHSEQVRSSRANDRPALADQGGSRSSR
jgi:hypothetical protein